jgi:hypothetical protein
MNMVARVLVGIMALFFGAMGAGFWLNLETQAASFGLQGAVEASNLIGRVSVRADFGSFFLTIGILCGYAVWKRSGSAAVGAALLFGIALLGRIVSVALDGPAPGGTPPMVIEAVCVAILLWARSVWKKA